jgi:hypothetical protein
MIIHALNVSHMIIVVVRMNQLMMEAVLDVYLMNNVIVIVMEVEVVEELDHREQLEHKGQPVLKERRD